MRVGLVGGTFDPIHRGHLDVAEAARAALNLERVWFLPAGLPSHRRPPVASPAQRFAMVALAVAPYPHFGVSDADLHGDAPVYTDETLARWKSAHHIEPAHLAFVTGADAFADIRTWRNYPRLLDKAHFAVVSRPGRPVALLAAALPELAGRMQAMPGEIPLAPSILLVDASTTDISSTAVRDRVAAGQSIEDVVPGEVAAYIREYGIYGKP